MSRRFDIKQLPTGSYAISGSFSGSFQGDGSQLTGIVSSSYAATASFVPEGVGGIYGGNGTVPLNTNVTLTNNINFDSGTFYIDGASNRVGIGTITPNYILDVSGSTNIDGNTTITGSLIVTTSVTASSYTGSFVGDGSQLTGIISSKWSGSNPITRDSDVEITGSFNVAGQTTLFSTGSGTLKVQGSGSDQPVFTVQGSTGELFSVTDSLTGSLFSVNDISGLPILEVFSDNTTLIGNYLDPMLITTAKVTQTNSGSFVLYSLPTASYDTAFFEYSVRSGSNARAGTIMAIQSGSAVNFTETTTTDFGSTTAISFVVVVTGSNMALTGSSTTGSWTIKSIIRGI